MDQLTGMKVFRRVVELEGFSAAARSIGLSNAAVSKHVSELEKRLNAQLLKRTTRRVGLTEVGSAYYERCARVLDDIDEAELAVANMEAAPRGTLKLSLPFAFGRMHVAPIVPEFLTRYPDVRIHLTGNNRLIDLVDEGADLAIRIGKLADSSLIAKRLAPNRLVVCGAPAYFDRMGVPQQPAELTRHNCISFTYRSARDHWRFLGPDGAEEVVQVSGNVETNDGDTAREIALEGLGIAHMPLWLIGHQLRSGRLIEVLSNYDAPDSAIYAVYPPARHLSPKVRSFVDFLAERFARDDAWCSGC